VKITYYCKQSQQKEQKFQKQKKNRAKLTCTCFCWISNYRILFKTKKKIKNISLIWLYLSKENLEAHDEMEFRFSQPPFTRNVNYLLKMINLVICFEKV
jgi:hypothetical protein